MAALKILYDNGHATQWFTDLTHVAVSGKWDIKDGDWPERGKTPEDEAVIAEAMKLVSSTRMGQFGEGQDRAVLVVMESPHMTWREGVIAPVGSIFLMGEDGRTIDRVP